MTDTTASEDDVITVRDVTVRYRSYNQPPTSLKESVIRFFKTGSAHQYSTFDALSQLSFSIKRGEIFGIIGSNGSGKSTLLKVLAQVLKPVEGSLEVRGSVASLIELGVGFDPELNAIENIYLHNSLHRRNAAEVRARVDHILQFAELGDFATTPIKYYSSGMAARLGFSVAIDINPDILLVDEILAVGDERFQEKCDGAFRGFVQQGKTIVVVSHNMSFVESFAKRVLLLSRGKTAYLGAPGVAVEAYRDEAYRTALA